MLDEGDMIGMILLVTELMNRGIHIGSVVSNTKCPAPIQETMTEDQMLNGEMNGETRLVMEDMNPGIQGDTAVCITMPRTPAQDAMT